MNIELFWVLQMFARLMFLNRHLPIQPERSKMFPHYAREALRYTLSSSSQIRLHHFVPKCQSSALLLHGSHWGRKKKQIGNLAEERLWWVNRQCSLVCQGFLKRVLETQKLNLSTCLSINDSWQPKWSRSIFVPDALYFGFFCSSG